MDTKQRLTPEQLETEIRENLSGRDLKAFDMLCMKPTDEHITELLSRNEDLRAQLLYEEGMRSPNAFVREWFAFNLNLNNILAAVICRKHGFDIRKAIVGEGEVQDALRSSNQKDFGLSATLPEIDRVVYVPDTDFGRALRGKETASVIEVMDELMTVIQAIQPRLYDGVMRKISEI